MSFRTIEWTDEAVVMIDQRLLPVREIYVKCRTYQEVAEAIKEMIIRGAPAIGVAAAMGIALGAQGIKADRFEEFYREYEKICDLLAGTRPTAVNLFWAVDRMKRLCLDHKDIKVEKLKELIREEALKICEEDIEINKRIGKNGNSLIPHGARILTHWNAGALATAGYGTALGVIRAAHETGKNIQVFADETRPFLQGARLRAWELQKDNIPVTLITDNMAGYFMKKGMIDLVIVGADRNIREVTHVFDSQIAQDGVKVLNPAFDVTPNRYITAIITEKGVMKAPFEEGLKRLFK